MLMRTLEFRDLAFVGGLGPYLFDAKGNKYLDFFCDVGTSSLGYGSRESRKALNRLLQPSLLDGHYIPIHAPNLFRFQERETAAAKLCHHTRMDAVFFCNSGTEAVEAAIKLARLYQHTDDGHARSDVFSVYRSFHGRTYGALSAGDGPEHHYRGFEPLAPGFRRFRHIEDISEDAAAVILAPVFGNNDVQEYPREWLQELRDFTRENGIVLIFDEVQTGSGRTGAFTYAETVGIDPDVICLAKGLGMGAPVGAMLCKDSHNVFSPGVHFSTFGGNPFSCVMINAMADWFHDHGAAVAETGELLHQALCSLGWTKNVRGPGMLKAFDYSGDCLALARAAQAEGLLIGAFRSGPGPVKITPPLNISHTHIQVGISSLDAAARALR